MNTNIKIKNLLLVGALVLVGCGKKENNSTPLPSSSSSPSSLPSSSSSGSSSSSSSSSTPSSIISSTPSSSSSSSYFGPVDVSPTEGRELLNALITQDKTDAAKAFITSIHVERESIIFNQPSNPDYYHTYDVSIGEELFLHIASYDGIHNVCYYYKDQGTYYEVLKSGDTISKYEISEEVLRENLEQAVNQYIAYYIFTDILDDANVSIGYQVKGSNLIVKVLAEDATYDYEIDDRGILVNYSAEYEEYKSVFTTLEYNTNIDKTVPEYILSASVEDTSEEDPEDGEQEELIDLTPEEGKARFEALIAPAIVEEVDEYITSMHINTQWKVTINEVLSVYFSNIKLVVGDEVFFYYEGTTANFGPDAVTGSIEISTIREYIYKDGEQYYHYHEESNESGLNIRKIEIEEEVARETVEFYFHQYLASTLETVEPENLLNEDDPGMITTGQARGTDLIVTVDFASYGIWVRYEFDNKGIVKHETTRQVAEYGEVERISLITCNTVDSATVSDAVRNHSVTN